MIFPHNKIRYTTNTSSPSVIDVVDDSQTGGLHHPRLLSEKSIGVVPFGTMQNKSKLCLITILCAPAHFLLPLSPFALLSTSALDREMVSGALAWAWTQNPK